MKMRRYISLLLALIICLLCGCAGGDSSPEKQEAQPEQTRQPETLPPQQQMADAELAAVSRRAEYSAIAAAIALDEFRFALQGYVVSDRYGYLGDVDKDGEEELIYGSDAFLFDLSDGKKLTYQWEQSGNQMWLASDGSFYLQAGVSGSYDYYEDGKDLYWEGNDDWFKEWDGNEWVQVISTSQEETLEIVDWSDWSKNESLHYSFTATVYGESMTEEAYHAYLDQRGMTRLTNSVSEYTVSRYDASYTDSILSALDTHFAGRYSGYSGRITADYDADGLEETLFVIPGLLEEWNRSLYDNTQYPEQLQWVRESSLDTESPRTAVLTADVTNGELVIRAVSLMDNLYASASSRVEYLEGCLWIDGTAVYVPGQSAALGSAADAGFAEACSGFSRYLEENGYYDPIMKLADISDAEGQELLCLCRKDGVWYLLVFLLRDGSPVPISQTDLSSNACYLVEHEGQMCLMIYHQSIQTTMGGDVYNSYSYDLTRYDAAGMPLGLEYEGIYVNSGEEDATQTAAFFEKFNRFLVNVIVIYDPFLLQGQQWMSPEQADYTGSSQENSSDMEEGQLGFVQIEDPGSWLNLRVGPGTEYDRVLVDPNNPESFVRQALGSPVTVLETIETGDPDNPVWVKIRIIYGDQEIVGYSSRRYIRLADES